MSDGEVVFDKRIQANIPSELKERVRDLMLTQDFNSEAEVVRAALWQFMETWPSGEAEPAEAAAASDVRTVPSMPEATTDPEFHRDLKVRMDLVAWLLTLILMLVATVSSKLLSAVCREKVEPLRLLDQTVNQAVQDRGAVRRTLALGWRDFNRAGRAAHRANGSNGVNPNQRREPVERAMPL